MSISYVAMYDHLKFDLLGTTFAYNSVSERKLDVQLSCGNMKQWLGSFSLIPAIDRNRDNLEMVGSKECPQCYESRRCGKRLVYYGWKG